MQSYIDRCLEKTGAYPDHPFGEGVVCVKVKGRIFAQFFHLKGEPKATFKCRPAYGEAMKQSFPDVIGRAYHCPASQQPYWFTVAMDAALPWEQMEEIIDQAYEAVVEKLTKAARAELLKDDPSARP